MNHKGNWLGTFLDKFWMNKEQFTRARFESATSGIDVPALYQLSYLALHCRSPYLSISLFGGGGGGASQKSGITPKLRYNLGRGSKGCTKKGYDFFL